MTDPQQRQPVVVVTGGSHGIGAVTVDRLVRDEYLVGSLDIVPAGPLPDVLRITCDLAEEQQLLAAVARVSGEFGGVDAVIVVDGGLSARHG